MYKQKSKEITTELPKKIEYKFVKKSQRYCRIYYCRRIINANVKSTFGGVVVLIPGLFPKQFSSKLKLPKKRAERFFKRTSEEDP